jgi:hypothetical protein
MNDTNERKHFLFNVLKEFVETKKWRYNSQALQDNHCFYAASVLPYLKDYGYLDKSNNLSRPIKNINFIINDIVRYYNDRRLTGLKADGRGVAKKTRLPKNLYPKDTLVSSLIDMANFDSADLVKELRSRGFDVTAVKVVREEL